MRAGHSDWPRTLMCASCLKSKGLNEPPAVCGTTQGEVQQKHWRNAARIRRSAVRLHQVDGPQGLKFEKPGGLFSGRLDRLSFVVVRHNRGMGLFQRRQPTNFSRHDPAPKSGKHRDCRHHRQAMGQPGSMGCRWSAQRGKGRLGAHVMF